MRRVAVLILACITHVASAQTDSMLARSRELRARLAEVTGQFSETGVTFSFSPGSPADTRLIDSTVALDSAVVPLLVECLADSSRSRVVFYGGVFESHLSLPIHYPDAPVSRGAICFWVLTRTSWAQHQFRENRSTPGFMDDKWVSYRDIDVPTQRRARDAWRVYLANHPISRAWPVP